MLVEMKIKGLAIDPQTNTPIVLLSDLQDTYTVPIWIGILEASAIATEMEKMELSRPMTHDLLINVLDELKAKVERIVVHDLRDSTFYANIYMRSGEREFVLDARPSDSIALALRAGASIWMENRIIEQSGLKGEEDESEEGVKKKKLGDIGFNDFPKYKM